MRKSEVTDRAVSIWLSGENSAELGELTSLVRSTLREAGLRPWSCVEAEVFEAGGDFLLIARPGHRQGFYFPGLEELLGGALACPDAPSSLYLCPDGYLLALAPEAVCPALYEFGKARPLSPGWECHAAEQGLSLLARDAIRILHSYFTT